MNKTTEKILIILKDSDDFISSRDICANLAISRSAVWKHIQQLKELGYTIESVSRHGYKLLKNCTMPHACEVRTFLQTEWLGREYTFHKEVVSTNQVAMQAGFAGATHGTVFCADQQTSGRGRMSRNWFSPPLVNLYFSSLLRPQVTPSKAPELAILAAYSLQRSMANLSMPIQLKWPNDLLCGVRKLAGVLCEMSAEIDYVHHLAIGIGMNVNITQEQFPKELADSAISLLMITQKEHSRSRVMAKFLNTFEKDYELWLKDGLAPFLKEINNISTLNNRRIEIKVNKQKMMVTAIRIQENGSLLVKTETGENISLFSGEVTLAK